MTTHSSSTFQNDHLEVSVVRNPGCKIALDVSVKPEAVRAGYEQAIMRVRKEVSIPGFRKGKVPEAMVKQKYSKFIDQEWKEILLHTSFDESIRLIKIRPFNENSVHSATLKSVSQDQGATLSYTYEAAPEIPVIAPETLSLPVVPLDAVSQADVDLAIEELCLRNGAWSDVTDRPAQEGDFVEVDIDDIGENPKNICTNTVLHLEKVKTGDWMRRLLVGKNPGETVEGMSEQDVTECKACEDGSHVHSHSDFVPTLCRITLHAIKQVTPHVLDDALAKKYGADTVEVLLERVQEKLKQVALEKQRDQQRFLMEKELLTHYPFDMPASLVEGELKANKKHFFDQLRSQGVEEAEILTEWKKMAAETEQRYDRDFRLYFLTQKYAHAHDLKVSDDEVWMEWLRRTMWERRDPRSLKDNKEMLSQLRLQLLSVKAIDLMVEKAQKQH